MPTKLVAMMMKIPPIWSERLYPSLADSSSTMTLPRPITLVLRVMSPASSNNPPPPRVLVIPRPQNRTVTLALEDEEQRIHSIHEMSSSLWNGWGWSERKEVNSKQELV
mmetsp:Transcript_8594/g.24574  ORF Transcript_8594/g.24574 Transcript_8594/m.24574 type:complete len:109 (-) Transcript_8594:109-435(-)